MSGVTATVFGGTGFLGRYIINNLGACGSRIIVPNRSEEDDASHLKVMGDLGQLYVLGPHFNIMDDSAIKRAVEQSDVVINLIGARFESWNWKFKHVHIDLAEKIAKATKEVGRADRFIQLSHVTATADSPSERMRTKHLGDEAVRALLPHATIVKCAPVVGEEDHYVNYFMDAAHKNRIAMINGGRRRVQPVWAKDVADGVLRIVELGGTTGKTYYFGGPSVYSEWDVAGRLQDMLRSYDYRVEVPEALARLSVLPYQFLRDRVPLPIATHPVYRTVDFITERTLDEVVPEGAETLRDLGIEPFDVFENGHILDFVRSYRAGGYEFGEKPPSAH